MTMLREELQKALKESMLNKDTDTVSAVRLIIAGMKEEGTAFVEDAKATGTYKDHTGHLRQSNKAEA